ncbi:alpha/beta hydrolase [Marivita sp. GX14005]|uniref:alpha/beta fold hydrolase n=1 Tax=Marivita sp. GX14005 TaxID=2942276 RepID=UPI0020183EAA|nr:alpha/beta hydrolase [Marivita sp. GX14005]MCL3883517.1 alpha/beta hydrolase [Marivita sp. GX14005]
MTDPAPFRADLAQGPDTSAFWVHSSDGVRLRVGHAKARGEAKGTIFLFSGRTEYMEKYGHTARSCVQSGFDLLGIDWRGQGLSDRLVSDPMIGHVDDFASFQKDWSAMRAFAAAREVPKPWFLIAHSMGGTIGLRALMNGADFRAAMFSAPMWGINIGSSLRPAAVSISWAASRLGQGHRIAPGMSAKAYPKAEAFEDNLLTTDREMYDMMRRHVEAEPRFGLGGPSLQWLRAALKECDALAKLPSPALPALCFLGSRESIVDTKRIRERMTHWRGGKLLLVDGAKHEVLMEKPATRRQVEGAALSLFSSLSS